ncbi:MAG: hypothetical protein A2X49_07450 [Lentisphaerae bacterium GWF2_52_8]|nr:MAG: hypothetical protein A2X49_07450 [Lentisphaerae bacterium GWF2_52_8]
MQEKRFLWLGKIIHPISPVSKMSDPELKDTRKKARKLRHRFEYVWIFLLYHLVRILPLRALFIMAKIASTFFMIWPPYRRVILENLRAAFPEKSEFECRLLGWKSAGNTCLMLMEFFWFIGRSDRIRKYAKVDVLPAARELLDRRKAEGKGVLLIAQHLGNWEVAGLSFSEFLDYPFAVVGRTLPNPHLDKLIFAGRSTNKTRVISAKGAVKGMMQAFKEGYFVATLVDQNTKVRDGGIFVNFFGLPVPTSRAPALFAKKLDLPCVFVSCTRNGLSYTTEISLFEESFSKYGSDEAIIQGILSNTERFIRKYPEQYIWFYKRFQHIPQEADEDLKKKYPDYAEIASGRFYSKVSQRDQTDD